MIITVAIPVLGRPQRIQRTIERFPDPRLDVLFLPDEGDTETITELDRLGARYSFAHPAPPFNIPTFASKINHAYTITDLPFLLYASDDVRPHTDWVTLALKHLEDDSIAVLATNDELNRFVARGQLATHGIIRRGHVEQYGPLTVKNPIGGPLMHEGYRHHSCDVELSVVARRRGVFKYAPDVILTHDKRREPSDATYALGQSYRERDKAERERRVPTWPNT